MFRRTVSISCLLFCLALGSAPAQYDNVKPSILTEKFARTYVFKIPAPRGQIVDRNGEPLAVTRVCQNLGISFPTPLDYPETKALAFAHEQIEKAERLTGRKITIPDKTIERHFRNRGVLPLDIAQDLTEAQQAALKGHLGAGLVIRPMYVRSYPNGALAAHILGYAGRAGAALDGPIENNELLWPEAEGREGLEATFNDQLTGKPGLMRVHFDATGKKDDEKILAPPEPGCTVVTTLDVNLQRLCEKALEKGVKRGAIVFMAPNSGDILAMASWPSFDPNLFIPAISAERYKTLNENPNLPLLPRAYRSAYPPGSTFKTISGLAALESGAIKTTDTLPGPASLQVGNLVMRNWKKTDAGLLTFAEALEQSCNTWFFQAGINTGAKPIIDFAARLGLGKKTGIPLNSEAEGTLATADFLKKNHIWKLLDGDAANLAIGQGFTLVTPLQMAQAMATLGNGGTLFQTRLVSQVQSLDRQIVIGYDPRIKDQIEIKPENLAELKRAMINVITGAHGTGARGGVDNVDVAGKTGTAQWGPKTKERYALWFAGFAPAEKPAYAFVALYESDIGENRPHGGTVAAPMIGQVLKELFKEEAKPKKAKKSKAAPIPSPAEEENAGD